MVCNWLVIKIQYYDLLSGDANTAPVTETDSEIFYGTSSMEHLSSLFVPDVMCHIQHSDVVDPTVFMLLL